MQALISSPEGSFILEISSMAKANPGKIASLFETENFIRGQFYCQKVSTGVGKEITKYHVGMQRDHLDPIFFTYRGRNYAFRARNIIYMMRIIKNKDEYALDLFFVLKADMPITNEKIKAYPLPVPNIWRSGIVCMGSAQRRVASPSLGMATEFFINEFWGSVFRSDLHEAIEAEFLRDYMIVLSRKSRSDIKLINGEVDKFIAMHSRNDAHKPISNWLQSLEKETER